MAIRIEPGAEPIPGYKLIERLGGGGFGEVWKAEVPGGLFKAIKFVFGDLQGADADGARAEQELKALSRVKTVHHPYILSLERYDIIDGRLIIVMELADRTLWDRYKEARGQGLVGIPREELLSYMQESAEALDLMNIQFQLQHLDIKPQNIFLVFNHVKVADFGLVKDLGNMAAATITGGVTPVYAAPETFDGWLSRFSDQYSLAIVYQELLTGQRPFAGTTMRQLVLQHVQNPPDMSALPIGDREAIGRALAKDPNHRFPTCVEMVQALKAASKSATVVAAKPVVPLPPGRSEPRVAQDPTPSGGIFAKTWNARGVASASSLDIHFDAIRSPNELRAGMPLTSNPDVMLSTLEERNAGLRADEKSQLSSLSALAGKERGPASVFVPPRRDDLYSPRTHQTPKNPPTAKSKSGSASPSRPEKTTRANAALRDGDNHGIVQPALIVGLGQLGLETMHEVRRILAAEFGAADVVPRIRFMGIDTDPDTIRRANCAAVDARLPSRPNELVLAKLQRPNHYLTKFRGEDKLPTQDWLNPKLLYRVAKDNSKAPVRALGRFALVNNFAFIVKRIETELQACVSDDTLPGISASADLGIRTSIPRVYVVANLGGATGSGMFLDLAYLVRGRLRAIGMEKAEIVGLFFMPTGTREGIRSQSLANSYAALSELDFFQKQSGMRATYKSFEHKEVLSINESGPPFQRCFFLQMPEPKLASEQQTTTPEVVFEAAQFLYRDLATNMGKALDQARQRKVRDLRFGAGDPGAVLESFGLHKICWPRRDIQKRLAESFCAKLVDRWKTKDCAAIAASIEKWVGEQWEVLEMRPEALIERHHERLNVVLKSTPDKIFNDLIQPIMQVLQPKSGAVNIAPVLSMMDQVEKLLGVPEQCRELLHRPTEPGSMELALIDVSNQLADVCDGKLAEMIVALIEAPSYRLAGAEEALRKLNRIAEEALRVQEGLAGELADRAASLYKRIHDCVLRCEETMGKASGSSGSMFFSRKSNAAAAVGGELLDLLRQYPKTQFQALLLHCLNRLYISLRGHLSDQLREVGFCRQRLDELGGLLLDRKERPIRAGYEKQIFPAECSRIDEIMERLDAELNEDDFLALDDHVQEYITKNYKALLNICLGPSSTVIALAPVMVRQAIAYIDQRFPPPNIVDLLKQQGGGAFDMADAVRAMYEEASPETKRNDSQRDFGVLTLPSDDAGRELAAAIAIALPEAAIVHAERSDEIVIHREQILGSLNDLEQMGAIAQEAYRQRQAQDPSALHAREDIPNWNPEAMIV